MFDLLTQEKKRILEKISCLVLEEMKTDYLNDEFIERFKQSFVFEVQLTTISVEELGGSLDEYLFQQNSHKVELKIPKSLSVENQHLVIAKGIARIVLQHYQEMLNNKEEDYLFGTKWTHTQNEEIYYLALCLLMPKEKFKTIIEEKALNKKNNCIDLTPICECFKVPERMVIQRGVSLNLFKN